jgi:phosphoglycolate phosphatase
MTLTCNICGGKRFETFGYLPRPDALCSSCGSLERHRAMHHLLRERGRLDPGLKGRERCLQLAPERVTHDVLLTAYGSGYTASDLAPKRYQHAQCLRLQLPDDFQKIPDGYFNLIVHNHVLEHIPGPFREHIDAFARILAPDGVMAFTIPDQAIVGGVAKSVEGGEQLPNDQDRLEAHGQEDHYKTFGLDLIDHLQASFSSVECMADRRDAANQTLVTDHNAWGIVFWCRR